MARLKDAQKITTKQSDEWSLRMRDFNGSSFQEKRLRGHLIRKRKHLGKRKDTAWY